MKSRTIQRVSVTTTDGASTGTVANTVSTGDGLPVNYENSKRSEFPSNFTFAVSILAVIFYFFYLLFGNETVSLPIRLAIFLSSIGVLVFIPRALMPDNDEALKRNIEAKYGLVLSGFHLLTDDIVYLTDPDTGERDAYILSVDDTTFEPTLK